MCMHMEETIAQEREFGYDVCEAAEDMSTEVNRGVDIRRSPKADLVHLEDGTVLGLDALKETWLGQHKLDGRLLEVVVGLRLGLLLHEGRQVALRCTHDW